LWEKNHNIEKRKIAKLIQISTGFNVLKSITIPQFNAVIGRGSSAADPIEIV
jgi:hypothetical protein